MLLFVWSDLCEEGQEILILWRLLIFYDQHKDLFWNILTNMFPVPVNWI